MSKGLKIPAFFKAKERLAEMRWVRRQVKITDGEGRILEEMSDVEAPESWSQQAVNIVARQYFRHSLSAGAPERSVRALVHRVVSTIRKSGEEQGYFASREDAESFESELSFLILSQRASFNSPVWFNCGLWHEYGETGAGGNWAWNEAIGRAVQIANGFERPQVSACFIQSLADSLSSIFELVRNEARLFKYGSGTGTNFSNLRGRQEALAGGGQSSGLMSFLDVFDRAAGATKSGGTTRRAAKMVCLDLDHPEIMDFVRWKAKEEAKAQALIRAGFSGGMDGEAYRTVSGQNSNNSVRVTRDFLNRVKNDESWSTRSRTDGSVVETFPARQLWRSIAESAWICADPGVQYQDTIQDWHTCKQAGPIRASNPCSEYMFLDDTACNLSSINLKSFFDREGHFDRDGFLHSVRLLILAQEILVDFASYPQAVIAERSHAFRPLGLGFANLGALLMSLGFSYDEPEGRDWAAVLSALMGAASYRVSAEIAEARGAFSEFEPNRESMLGVIEKHGCSARDFAAQSTGEERGELWALATKLWEEALSRGRQFGFRNAQTTAIAPTGTIAFMMDCDTTGIEPEYALIKQKQLAGGGVLTTVNGTVGQGLRALGRSEEESRELVDVLKAEGETAFQQRLSVREAKVFLCAAQLRADAHLEMMAAVQPFISGAISKTVNLHADASVEDVASVFERGAALGLKSVAVYRDGSKQAQPLKRVGDNELSASFQISPDEVSTCPICSYPTVICGTCWVCPQCGHSLACS